MATARMSIGSIFTAVGQTATTLATTLEAVNAGVGMANQAIQSMATNQKVRAEYDAATFEETLHAEKAQELADSTLAACKFRGQSQAHAEAYDAAFTRLAEIRANRKP